LIHNEVPNTYFLPYRGYSDIGMKENTAVSSYNAVQASFRHPFGRGLTFQASYTWSHGIDDASSTFYRSFVDDSNLSRWRATSDLNRAQVLVMNYVYALPFFKTSSNGFCQDCAGRLADQRHCQLFHWNADRLLSFQPLWHRWVRQRNRDECSLQLTRAGQDPEGCG